ncbi:MAG TPA: glycosyltransferase family 2 protein [Opitutaceae bacterium]|nr:glycosyltransferase family 2 protein [Opitutaceae bacterium]
MFSVLILTLNEEHNLPACLASVAPCDDIVVLDSGSADRTVELARSAGARVWVHPFTNFAQQRNYAHATIDFRHPWVLHLDADERLTPALFEECARCPDDAPYNGWWIAPKMLFFGRWVPHCTDYPAWQARLVRARGFEFIQVGHGQREAPGMRMGRLRENYLHEMMAGGVDEWLAKHRRYAREEAAAYLAAPQPEWQGLFSASALVRRRAWKKLSYSLPCRSTLRFVYQYALRRGFLDGAAGFRYCRLLARYEGFTARALREMKRPPRS